MDWANQEATRVGDSNCGGLFSWSDLCRNSQHVYSRLSCRLQRLRNLRLLRDTNKSTDFHVFPKPFPTAGLTAQLHKQSPVGATRQLLAKIGVDTAENEPLEVWGKIIQYYSFVSLHEKPPPSCSGRLMLFAGCC